MARIKKGNKMEKEEEKVLIMENNEEVVKGKME